MKRQPSFATRSALVSVCLAASSAASSTAASAVPAAGPTAPAVGQTSAAAPVIDFDRVVHDYGRLWEGESRVTTFAFRNTGDAPLEIRSIKASCGCTTTQLDRTTFAPGEGDAITVTFAAKGRGSQRKTITIITNAGPPIRLAITSDVRQFLSAEPAILRVGDLRMTETRTFRVRFASADPSFTPEGVTIRGAATRFVTARLVPAVAVPSGPQLPGSAPAGPASAAPAAGAFDVEVTVRPGAPWGSLFASLRVWGQGTKPGDAAGRTRHTHDMSVSGRVFGEVMASDTMIRVSRVAAGKPFRRVVTFRSRSGEPLDLRAARLVNPSLPSMTATLSPDEATEGRIWRLVVEADPGTTLGRVSGSVIVTTGIPGEDRLTFLVAGMIADDGA